MGVRTASRAVEMIAHGGMVIVKGFGADEILLSPKVAEQLAAHLSATAFAADAQHSAVVLADIPRTEWPSKAEPVQGASTVVPRRMTGSAASRPERSFDPADTPHFKQHAYARR